MTGSFRFPPGPFTTSLDYPRYPAGRAIALAAVAGLVGVCTTAIASALGWGFPSFGYLFETVVWKLVTIGMLIWGLQYFEHRRPDLAVVGYRQSEGWPVGEVRRRSRKAMVGLGVGAILFVPFSFLGTSAGNPSAYGSVHHASLVLILAQLLVCYRLLSSPRRRSSADGSNLGSDLGGPLRLHFSGRATTSNNGARFPLSFPSESFLASCAGGRET